jgi:hypothetical protein
MRSARAADVRLTVSLTLVLTAAAGGAYAAPAMAANAPAGYQRVQTVLTAPHGPFDAGSAVTCPAGKVVWGGGVTYFGGFAGIGNSINTSAPNGETQWRARYNDDTDRDIQFEIQAVCANRPANYSQQFANAANPAHTQSHATAICPIGTVLLSGGVFSTSDVASVFVLSAFPKSQRKFRAVMWNGSDRNEQMSAFAVCAHKPPKYVITSQTGSDGGGPSTDIGGGQCPTGTTAIGGGSKVLSPNPGIYIGGGIVEPDMQWLSEVVNSTTASATVSPFAICAAG